MQSLQFFISRAVLGRLARDAARAVAVAQIFPSAALNMHRVAHPTSLPAVLIVDAAQLTRLAAPTDAAQQPTQSAVPPTAAPGARTAAGVDAAVPFGADQQGTFRFQEKKRNL